MAAIKDSADHTENSDTSGQGTLDLCCLKVSQGDKSLHPCISQSLPEGHLPGKEHNLEQSRSLGGRLFSVRDTAMNCQQLVIPVLENRGFDPKRKPRQNHLSTLYSLLDQIHLLHTVSLPMKEHFLQNSHWSHSQRNIQEKGHSPTLAYTGAADLKVITDTHQLFLPPNTLD